MFLSNRGARGRIQAGSVRRDSESGQAESQGSALVAVVGIMSVGLVLIALLATTLTGAITVSSVGKANLQAQAAAEAGVATAVAALNVAGTCENAGGTFTSSTAPVYRATVWWATTTSSWTRGCPTSQATKVRVISGGTAANSGLLQANGSNIRYVEAIYAWGTTSAPFTNVQALYTYGGANVDTYEFLSGGQGAANINIPSGDFECTGPTLIEGSLTVAAGNANLTNTCHVTGSVTASGTIAMTSYSSIDGDATSATGGISLSNSTVTVGGSVYANGSVTLNGRVNGNIEATGVVTLVGGSYVRGNVTTNSTLSTDSTVDGSLSAIGNLTIGSGHIKGNVATAGTLKYGKLTNAAAATALKADGLVDGTISYGASGLVTVTPKSIPTVINWVDLNYSWSSWQAAGFTQQLTWPSAIGCRIGDSNSTTPTGALYPWYQQLKNLNQPTVVDGRSCGTTGLSGNMTLALKTDVAFIANTFNYDSLTITSADGQQHRIWFIILDGDPNTFGPQCPRRGGTFALNTPSSVGSNVIGMVYTPCDISVNNGSTWNGMFYSGTMTGGGGVRQLVYVPLGVPGSTIGGGSVLPPSGNGTVGALISTRNRTDNGE